MVQPTWMSEAWAELGQREVPGSRHNPRITAFISELGHHSYAKDETPWCAAFVGACLERAGHASTRSLLARSYSDWGEDAGERLGCVAVLSRGSNPAQGHVGFLVGATQDRLWLLGGNQSNSVSVQSFPRSRLLAFRWPRPAAGRETEGAGGEVIFQQALAHVLAVEGGFTDDPYDPGGPTNMGITLRTLARFKGVALTEANRATMLKELKSVSEQAVRQIYRAFYWEKAKCAEMPPALAFMHFDTAVNHGVTGAARILQEAVGVEVDGEIGPITRRAFMKLPVVELLRIYARIREGKYREMAHFWRFGRGWLNRLQKTLAGAEEIAKAGDAITASRMQKKETDMILQDGVPAPKWWGRSMTIWGAIITAAATVLPVVGPIIGIEISADFIRQFGDEAVKVAQAIAGLAGTLLTIYGRARADQPLKFR